MQQPPDVRDVIAAMGGEVLEITEFNRKPGEGQAMTDKMQEELKRLRYVQAEHLEKMNAHRQQAAAHRDGAQACQGAIETLERLLAPDEDPEDDNGD